MKLIHDPVMVARMFLFVREVSGKQNFGQRVEGIQKWSGGIPGDSYCCHFATMVLDICFQGNSPIPREGACQTVYALAKKNGWVTRTPSVGDLFLYVNSVDHAHHIGFVTGVKPLVGLAANTSEDGKSSNGTGVFERDVHATVFIHYPR